MGILRKMTRPKQNASAKAYCIRVRNTDLYLHFVGTCKNGDGIYECYPGQVAACMWDRIKGSEYLKQVKDKRLVLEVFDEAKKIDEKAAVFVRSTADDTYVMFVDIDANGNHIYAPTTDYTQARIWPLGIASDFVSRQEGRSFEVVSVFDVIREYKK